MEGIKLEVGKYYRTRDGRKAFVAYVGKTPFCDDVADTACVIIEDEKSVVRYPWANGRISSKAQYNDKADLIAEWVEPKRISGWIAIRVFKDAEWPAPKIHATKEEAQKEDQVGAVVYIDVLGGEGLEVQS